MERHLPPLNYCVLRYRLAETMDLAWSSTFCFTRSSLEAAITVLDGNIFTTGVCIVLNVKLFKISSVFRYLRTCTLFGMEEC